MLIHTMIAAALMTQAGRYDGWRIADMTIDNLSQARWLQERGARSLSCIDHAGQLPMLVTDDMLELARNRGIDASVIVFDVEDHIRNEAAARRAARSEGRGGWYSDFRTWPEVNARLQQLADASPDLVTLFEAGTTHEGRSIMGVRITAPGDASTRARILFNGCQHAREWIAVMVPMYIADQLIAGYASDEDMTALLSEAEIVIVPIVNPDGYEYTYAPSGDRYWRKNRRNNPGSCEGVDLNRNWDIDWAGGDSTSSDTCSDVYTGPFVFSEPEPSAMRDLILSLPNFGAHIDFHSYSQLVLEAWGWTSTPPPNADVISTLGAAMSDAIAGVHGENYPHGTPGNLLYFADGTFQDWTTSVGALGYTIELRPDSWLGGGFELPASQIVPTCEENWPAALEMIRFVARPISAEFPQGVPQFVDPGVMTDFPVEFSTTNGDQIDPATTELHVRYGSNGEFVGLALTHNGGGAFTAHLPSSHCGLASEFRLVVATTGGATGQFPAGEGVYSTVDGGGVVGDVNCDGEVDVTDILATFAAWGNCENVCAADLLPDGVVNVSDLLVVIGNW